MNRQRKNNARGRRQGYMPAALTKGGAAMRYFAIMAAVLFPALVSTAQAENYRYRQGDAPEVEVWTNKGDGANYYYGEDVAVYFRAEEDCYVVVYDVDPSGEVNVLFPSSLSGSSYVTAGRVYRVPDYDDDYRMEVSGNSGTEHIFAVASYDYINPPDFMRYVGYDYGQDSYYDDGYFVLRARGNLSNFTADLNIRIVSGSSDYAPRYSVSHTRFIVDTNYRHHRQYRYWDTDPYYVSSVWVGADWPGGEVWIDGVYFGIAPILVPRVIVGYHWVWVYYGGYPCYQRYFYVPSYHRFTIDVRIDDHFRDHHYRRDRFRSWVFEEKKYRNEDGFRERAREARGKQVRTRSLPPSVVRDYTERGVLSKDAPIVKKARIETPDRDTRDRSFKPSTDPRGKTERNIERNKVDNRRENPNISEKKEADRKARERDEAIREKQGRGYEDNPRVIVPEKPKEPQKMKPVEREKSEQPERRAKPEKNNSSLNEGSREKAKETKEVKTKNREPEKNSGSVEREKPSKTEKSRESSSKRESQSTKKNGKSSEGKERGR